VAVHPRASHGREYKRQRGHLPDLEDSLQQLGVIAPRDADPGRPRTSAPIGSANRAGRCRRLMPVRRHYQDP